MPLDPRKRQKKIERRNAKQAARKKAIARQNAAGPATRIERAAAAPILHCCTCDMLADQGMANLLFSRELSSGKVAFVAFLVDMYCLGVKDVTWAVVSRARYDWQVYGKLFRDFKIVNLQPEYARKLIEGAVDYARGLGFAPHEDYEKAKLIFGNIDASACREQIVYGKNGKPFFIAGPHDSPARCRLIIDVLTDRCGPEGFHFLMPMMAAGGLPHGGRIVDLGDAGDD
jgi:hypothetical protein